MGKKMQKNFNERKAIIFEVLALYIFSWIVLAWFNWIIKFPIVILTLILIVFKNQGKNTEKRNILLIALTMGLFANICYSCLLLSSKDEHYFSFHRSIFKFGIMLTIFHVLEFVCIVISSSKVKITTTPYLLDPTPSKEYQIAIFATICEFFISSYFFPSLKFKICQYTDICGLYLSLIGVMYRCVAIIQAGDNFNHILQNKLSPKHQLITTGVYSLCRHPAYVGWATFSLAQQFMIGNLISGPISVFVIYNFFRERIQEEEAALIHTFNEQYTQYKLDTPFGFPFVS